MITVFLVFYLDKDVSRWDADEEKAVPHGDWLGPILGLKRSHFGTPAVPRWVPFPEITCQFSPG